jgi:hypothetical protein
LLKIMYDCLHASQICPAFLQLGFLPPPPHPRPRNANCNSSKNPFDTPKSREFDLPRCSSSDHDHPAHPRPLSSLQLRHRPLACFRTLCFVYSWQKRDIKEPCPWNRA